MHKLFQKTVTSEVIAKKWQQALDCPINLFLEKTSALASVCQLNCVAIAILETIELG